MTKFSLDGIQPIPKKSDGKVGLDTLRVHPDVALELMVHHLELAAMYFEAIPPDRVQNLKETERLLKSSVQGYEEPALKGARAFLGVLEDYYEKLKREDN